MKHPTRKSNPAQILQNLRRMIDEAEDILSRTSGRLNEEQLSELKERILAGFARLRDYSEGVGDRARDYYDEAEDRLRDYYEDIEDRLRSGMQKTGQTLRSHPYRAAAVGLGVALIVSALLNSTRKSR